MQEQILEELLCWWWRGLSTEMWSGQWIRFFEQMSSVVITCSIKSEASKIFAFFIKAYNLLRHSIKEPSYWTKYFKVMVNACLQPHPKTLQPNAPRKTPFDRPTVSYHHNIEHELCMINAPATYMFYELWPQLYIRTRRNDYFRNALPKGGIVTWARPFQKVPKASPTALNSSQNN